MALPIHCRRKHPSSESYRLVQRVAVLTLKEADIPNYQHLTNINYLFMFVCNDSVLWKSRNGTIFYDGKVAQDPLGNFVESCDAIEAARCGDAD